MLAFRNGVTSQFLLSPLQTALEKVQLDLELRRAGELDVVSSFQPFDGFPDRVQDDVAFVQGVDDAVELGPGDIDTLMRTSS